MGRMFAGTVGLGLTNVSRVEVISNTLSALPYSGIWAGWTKAFSERDFLYIHANDITSAMRRLRDGGAIYTNGGQASIFRNRIYRTGQDRFADAPRAASTNSVWAYDLYLDDMSLYWAVGENISSEYLSKNFTYNLWNNASAVGVPASQALLPCILAVDAQDRCIWTFDYVNGRLMSLKPTYSELSYLTRWNGNSLSQPPTWWGNWWNHHPIVR